MSATQAPAFDTYLASPACAPDPAQVMELNPQYGNIRMTTPIGRLSYVTLVKPRAVQVGQEPKFSATVLMHPDHCAQLWRAIVMVAKNRWTGEQRPNPQNPSQMVTMTGEHLLYLTKEQGGLHQPLRKGDDIYLKEPVKYGAYRGCMALNASIDAINRKSSQSQQPVCLDEDGRIMDPSKIYSGCYGRLQVTVFAFPQPGQQIPNRGVGMLLNAVQFARHGEKLGGFDAVKSAQSAFGALPKDVGGQPPADPAFGTNAGSPWSTPTGFAAPPPNGLPAGAPSWGSPPQGGGPVVPQGGPGGAPPWTPPPAA